MVARPIKDDRGHELFLATSEDRDLTLAFQRGQDGAYQAIYDRHSARVHAVCRRILVNPEDAAEASQEAFLRVFQSLGRFNGRYQLGAWITRIATNVCLDHLRARARRGGRDLTSLELADLEAPLAHEEGPEAVVVRKSEGYRVRKVLDSLPPMHRAAIALRDFEGLSYEEVANALGITDSQVKALLHRARQRFKRSWLTEVASIFVPWRLADRLRGTETGARDPVTAQAVSSVAQAAPACTTALQQCGQYVTERLAPVLTAALIGAAAAGPAVPAPASPAADEGPRVTRVDDEIELSVSQEISREKQRSMTVGAKDHEDVAASEEPPAVPPPGAEPGAEPTPSPTEAPPPHEEPTSGEPSSGDDEAQGSTGGQAVFEPPQPLMVAAGFDRGTVFTPRQPTTQAGTLDCSRSYLDQALTTEIEDGAKTYPAEISLRWRPTGLSMWVEITAGDYEISYPGAAYVTELQESGNELRLVFEGTYGSHPDAQRAGIPEDGPLRVEMSLDCAASSVIHETLTFGV